jgi:hypothetical protein
LTVPALENPLAVQSDPTDTPLAHTSLARIETLLETRLTVAMEPNAEKPEDHTAAAWIVPVELMVLAAMAFAARLAAEPFRLMFEKTV